MPSIVASLSELVNSAISIFVGLFHSVLAVFQAILSLGQDIVVAVFNLAQALFKATVDLLQGTVGLVWANLFLILFVGGGYYLYQTKAQKRSTRGKKKA